MLRIESYVTPIILSYVDKYIKNLKPEDSQVSLWGGDAVFSNLDLKLDVLEHDLKLPFSLVNGHIHELRIHVPWTKLTSEPIVITINTIECILKLKDAKEFDEDSGFDKSSLDGSTSDFRRKQKKQDIETPTSYIQGLINKIINNVTIVCNNVILKYVEDDIVLSINAKSLEMQSVDGNWQPSFTDLAVEELVLRNIVDLTDLTVCLDKRSAAGKIEVYQEPLLYRCSLSCRVIRKYESINSFQPSDTRYDIYCPQLHFSLSDTQLPMFLRLLELFLALYSKQLQYQPPKEDSSNISVNPENDNLQNEGSNDDESWSAWAWSLGSSLNPFIWDENDNSSQSQHRVKLHSTLQFGVYVKMATWIFKVTESVQDKSYFGPTKMQFTPFLRVSQQGSFFTAVIKGLVWANIRMGISSLDVVPVGRCICGIMDSEETNYMSGEKSCTGYIHCGVESQNYMSNSLFEEDNSKSVLWDNEFEWDNHFITLTEGSIMEKTSAFGVDYIYSMEIPLDASSEKLSEINANPECSIFNEKGMCRFVFGALKVNFSSGFYHRISAIIYGLRQSDYMPYSSRVKDEDDCAFIEPSEEEIDHLETSCPLRTYSVSWHDLAIDVCFAQHPMLDVKNAFSVKRKKKSRKSNNEINSAYTDPVPSLLLKFGRIDLEYIIPMYLKRLNSVVAYLKHPVANMLRNSHSHFIMKLNKCSVSLNNEEGMPVEIVEKFSFIVQSKSLLNPLLSSYENNSVMNASLDSEGLFFVVNVPQLQLIYCLANSWISMCPSSEELKSNSLISDAVKNSENYTFLKVEVIALDLKLCKTTSAYSGVFSIGGFSLSFRNAKDREFYYIANGPELKSNVETFAEIGGSEKLIKCSFQLPIENDQAGISTIFSLHILKISTIMEPHLITCLKYRPTKFSIKPVESISSISKQSEVKGSSKLSRKSSDLDYENLRKETTSTTISDRRSLLKSTSEFPERNEPPRNKSWKEMFLGVLPIINNLVISLEVESWIIFFPSQPLKIPSKDGLTNAVHRIYLTRGENSFLGDTSVICLPSILLQNSARKLSTINIMHEIPINQQLYWVEDKLPWSLKLSNFNLYSLQGVGESIKLPILKPVNTTATFAVSPKTLTPASSQASIVIHLDMTSVNFFGNRRQVETHVSLCDRLLNLIYFYMPQETEEQHILAQTLEGLTGNKESNPKTASMQDATKTKVHQESNAKTGNFPQYHEFTKEVESTSNKYQYEPGKSSVVDNSTSLAQEETTSKGHLDLEPQLKDTNSVSVTAWVQWTVASVSVSLFTTVEKESKKLKAEIEDLTMWVDLHQVYSKIKCKIANLNVMHYAKRNSEWVEGEMEGVILAAGHELTKDVKVVSPCTNPPQQPSSKLASPTAPAPLPDHASSRGFLSLTFTVAQCKNIHSKWNQMIKKHLREEKYIKECNTPQFLSEVDVRLQPFDVIFYPSTLQPFVSICEPIMDIQVPKKQSNIASGASKPNMVGQSLNNKVLPLMYVHTEPIRVFFPSAKASDQSNSQNVILMQLESVIISPQVDNPLSRVVLRQDIFTAAEQSRILGVPGSEVEDRQYQLDLFGFSVSTGSWYNVKKGRPRSLSSERLKVSSENPAFEWNNYDLSNEMEVVMYPFITRLDTRIIAAPAIIYNTYNEEGEPDEHLLIAGHSLEINATTDCNIYASLDQIQLANEIRVGILGFIGQIHSHRNGPCGSSLSSDLDSGVDCDTSSLDTSKLGNKLLSDSDSSVKVVGCNFVPLEVLITGSKVTVFLFEKYVAEGSNYPVKKNRFERRVKARERHNTSEVASTESEFSPRRSRNDSSIRNPKAMKVKDVASQFEEDGYEGSEEESVCEPVASASNPHMRIIPLIFVDISQPHTFLSLQPQKQKFELSSFDFIVKSIPRGFSFKVTDAKNLPVPEDYTIPWIETRPGDCHPKTGIPPAFLTFSVWDFFHQPAQVVLNLGRPFKLCLSQSKMDQIQDVILTVSKVIPSKFLRSTESENIDTSKTKLNSYREIFDGTMIDTVVNFVDEMTLKTSQIYIKLEVHTDCNSRSDIHASLSKMQLKFSSVRKKQKHRAYDSKDFVTELDFSSKIKELIFKTVYRSMEPKILLKPWSFSAVMNLLWLQWRREPYVNIKASSEVMQLDMGPENLLCLFDVYNYLKQLMPSSGSNERKRNAPRKDEYLKGELYSDLYSQDDLRAGVFEYVTCSSSKTENTFPQPYQVVCDRSSGLMAWCYPQPRALVKLEIYPVPLSDANESSDNFRPSKSTELEPILCFLQYYDPLRELFVTYERFYLSETKFYHLDLPTVHEERLIAVSTTWRICINYEEEGTQRKKNASVISPEVLGACVKVDSLFSVNILPTIEMYLIIHRIDLVLLNHMNLTGNKMPPSFIQYCVDNTAPKNQSFMAVAIDDISLRSNSRASGSRVETKFTISGYVLDFKYLIDNVLVEPAQFAINVSNQRAESTDKPENMDVTITNKSFNLHINQSAVHTLMISLECWNQAFLFVNKPKELSTAAFKESLPVVMMTNYIVFNNTREIIRVGQVDTNESLVIDPFGLHFYAWRSQKAAAKLQASSETSKWKLCESFSLDHQGIQVCSAKRPNDYNTKFLIVCKKFTPMQMCISIWGLLSFGNYLLEDLELRLIENSSHEDSYRSSKNVVVKSNSLSPSFLEEVNSFRVRFSSSSVWSIEIPLNQISTQSTTSIAIPLKGKKSSSLISCKLFKERVGTSWRRFIVLSAPVVVRSHLPRSLILFAHTPSINSTQQISVKGRGNVQVFNCDPSQVHHLTFQLSPELEVSKPPVQITKSLIEQVRRSSSSEVVDLTSMMENMFKGPNERWPYIDSSFAEGDFLFADQPEINLQIEFVRDPYECCNLIVDVRPWVLIVNHTESEFLLQEEPTENNSWYISPGTVFAPPKLESLFTFGVFSSGKKFFTSPLQISKEERWYTPSFEGKIPRSGSTNLQILLADKAIYFTILSRHEENIQVIHLVPTFSVSNNTEELLYVRTLCVSSTEEKLVVPDSISSTGVPPRDTNSTKIQEIPLLIWDTINGELPLLNDKETNFLQIGRNDAFSSPFNLVCDNQDRRLSITVPTNHSEGVLNEPFILTAHPVDSRIKVVLQEDLSPQMVIHNNTSEALLIGQESLSTPSCVEEELSVFSGTPSIDPFRSAYYTFPYTSEIFPRNLTAEFKHPRLRLALVSSAHGGLQTEILWSHGLNIYEYYDQFVNIPGFNDVKVHIETIGFTSHVFVDLVNRIEISAKDIRSRISSPPSKFPSSDIREKEKDLSVVNRIDAKNSYSDHKIRHDNLLEIAVKKDERLVSYVTFISSEFNVVIKRDYEVENYAYEVCRLSLDTFVISLRPKLNLSEKLRILNFNVRNQMEVNLFFKDAQIDNQMFSEGNFDFPVVLIRQNAKADVPANLLPLHPIERTIQHAFNDAIFSFSLVVERHSSQSFIQILNIRLKPISLYVEDKFIYSVLSYIKIIFDTSHSRSSEIDVETENKDNFLGITTSPEVLRKSYLMASPIRIGYLSIDDISVLLSVHASVKLYIAVDQSPLRFSQFKASYVMTTYYSLGQNLALHYLSGALFKAGWVVTSLDLLGNPVGFARTVSLGLKDFIQLPIEGILQGPWAFVAGITYGSLSLIKHLTTGTLVSVTNLANSVARNMDLLSLDEDYLKRNEAHRRTKSNGIAGSVLQGLSSFGISILGAIGGLAHQPIQAVLSDSVSPSSVVGSFGTGLMGVFTKPLGGAANFVVHTGQGLLQGAGWTQDLDRKAPPVKDYFKGSTSSSLKAIWKLLIDLPEECRVILCAADGTLLTASTSYTPVVLLLTSQVLFIVDVSTDTQYFSYSLHDLKWKCHPNDPTLLYLKKTPPAVLVISDDGEPISGCPERVADYVMSTYSEGVDGGEMSNQAFEEEFQAEENEPILKIYLSSRLRSFVVSCLDIATKALKGRGFIS